MTYPTPSFSEPPPNSRLEQESSAPTQPSADDLTRLDRAVWEDEGILDWSLRLSNNVLSLPGGTSVQVYARVKGPQPPSSHVRNSISDGESISESTAGYYGGSRATGLSKCKVKNVATTPISISKKVPVAGVYSVNNFDIPRIQSLLKPLPQSCVGDERSTRSVPERLQTAPERPFFLEERLNVTYVPS